MSEYIHKKYTLDTLKGFLQIELDLFSADDALRFCRSNMKALLYQVQQGQIRDTPMSENVPIGTLNFLRGQ